MNDMRDMRGMDGRRMPPRNARGEFRRRRRGDRGMDYGMYPDMRRGDGRVIRSYPTIHPQGADYGRDMNYDMARGGDMRSMDYRGGDYRGGQMSDRGDYGDMRRGDGHHYPEQMGGQTYYPIEAMGRFNGYWGMPQEDYGRGRDYGYGDMRGRRDYGDYGYSDYGDYGETLSEKELEEWCHKLKSQLDEREKQMFSKEMIAQKAKQMGKPMEGFGEKELEVATLMVYTDYKNSIGQNPDLAIKLAYDWLTDKDVKVKGAEKLAVYYDEIVMGGED
ncbi:MAG: hypothetical protein J6J71_04685 [Prevotella sp.]|nr:hypothetical protein [Prevotella sp.]